MKKITEASLLIFKMHIFGQIMKGKLSWQVLLRLICSDSDSPQEMIDCSALAFYKNSNDIKYLMKELKENGKVEYNDCEALRKDGNMFFASQNAQFYYDVGGQIQGVETLVRDITEYKKEKENNQMLNNLVDCFEDALLIVSITGIIAGFNKVAEQLYGYSAEEVIGKDISILAPKHLKKETYELINYIKQGKKICAL